jgi:hypothetical protein
MRMPRSVVSSCDGLARLLEELSGFGPDFRAYWRANWPPAVEINNLYEELLKHEPSFEICLRAPFNRQLDECGLTAIARPADGQTYAVTTDVHCSYRADESKEAMRRLKALADLLERFAELYANRDASLLVGEGVSPVPIVLG